MNIGRGGKAVLLLAATVIVLAGVRLASAVLLPFLLAMIIAAVTAPFVFALVRRGVPRVAAVTIAILVDLGALGGLGTAIGASLSSITDGAPRYEQTFRQGLEQAVLMLNARGMHLDARSFAGIVDPASVMGLVTTLLQSIAGIVSNLMLVLLIVGFMLFEMFGFGEKLRQILRDPDLEIQHINEAAIEVQKYLLVKTASSVVTGLFLWAVLDFLHVDFALALAVLAFLLNYLPTVGGIISTIPVVLVAFMQHGWGPAVSVFTAFSLFNFVMGNVVEPRIFGRVMGLSPMVVFLSMVFWGWLLGPVGALISVPLTMAFKLFAANTEDMRWIAVLLKPPAARALPTIDIRPTRRPRPKPLGVTIPSDAPADSSIPPGA